MTIFRPKSFYSHRTEKVPFKTIIMRWTSVKIVTFNARFENKKTQFSAYNEFVSAKLTCWDCRRHINVFLSFSFENKKHFWSSYFVYLCVRYDNYAFFIYLFNDLKGCLNANESCSQLHRNPLFVITQLYLSLSIQHVVLLLYTIHIKRDVYTLKSSIFVITITILFLFFVVDIHKYKGHFLCYMPKATSMKNLMQQFNKKIKYKTRIYLTPNTTSIIYELLTPLRILLPFRKYMYTTFKVLTCEIIYGSYIFYELDFLWTKIASELERQREREGEIKWKKNKQNNNVHEFSIDANTHFWDI